MADDEHGICMCGYTRKRGDCHILELSEEEQEFYRKMGLTPEKEILVCPPCWDLMKDHEHGTQLLKGVQQNVMNVIGVPKAGERAEHLRQELLKKVPKKEG